MILGKYAVRIQEHVKLNEMGGDDIAADLSIG